MDATNKVKGTTLDELQQLVDEWIRTYGVRYFDPLTNMAILTEETGEVLSLIHISEPTRPRLISYAVFCLKKKKK